MTQATISTEYCQQTLKVRNSTTTRKPNQNKTTFCWYLFDYFVFQQLFYLKKNRCRMKTCTRTTSMEIRADFGRVFSDYVFRLAIIKCAWIARLTSLILPEFTLQFLSLHLLSKPYCFVWLEEWQKSIGHIWNEGW